MSGVSLRGVTRRYGRAPAVDDVSLEVADGEFLVLLGPSGSGKSTLLRLIAGIEPLDAGEIWLGAERIDRLLPRYRDVAVVFQSYALYPHMSVFDNLAFPLRSVRTPRTEVRSRVTEVADLLDIAALLRRRPAQLSGGQQQRVALGRAIVRRPRLFLMDEPLSNLDAKLRSRTRLELVRLHERLGITTIYVTHDQVEAMTMGQRIAVIDGGMLHQVDRPETVYDHPADLMVAEFVGSPAINLIPARLRRVGSEVRLDAAGFRLTVAGRQAGPFLPPGVADGGEVICGIRPEHLHVNPTPAREPSATMTIDRVELLGHERLVHLRQGALQITARAGVDGQLSAGDEVTVWFDLTRMRLFDPDSGRLHAARDG